VTRAGPLTQIFETGQTIEVQGLAVDDDGAIFKGQGETENYVMSLFLNFTPSANIPSFKGCMLVIATNTVRVVGMWRRALTSNCAALSVHKCSDVGWHREPYACCCAD
jgi:hypothetical protein